MVCDISVCCAPDKLFADGAEGRLREERGAELVTFDDVNFSLLDGTSPLMEGEQTLSLLFGLWVSLSLTCGVWNTSYNLYLKQNSFLWTEWFLTAKKILHLAFDFSPFRGSKSDSYQHQFHFDPRAVLYHLVWMSLSSLMLPHFVI